MTFSRENPNNSTTAAGGHSPLQGRTVYVAIHSHKHGEDVTVHSSMENAYRVMAAHLRSSWDEYLSLHDEHPVPPSDDTEAVEVYMQFFEGEEWFNVIEAQVDENTVN